MHPAAPAPDERPASVTRGAYAAAATALGQLLTTAGAVGLATWTSPGERPGEDTAGAVVIVAWGLISAALLMVAAVTTLRRINGGRTLFTVVGIITLTNLALCGIYYGIVGSEIVRLRGSDSPRPPTWTALLGMTGAVLGLVAVIYGLVHYGRRTSRDWLKPPPPPVVYVPAPPYR
ncbi:hypothetical protein AB0I28_06030 [Phytomonospora sp. NPDC050363]|uniref:hypothetical protein n=1 Tax=Phytomonospora sp. NPDC050363 TaxID=3155642 RepID=UPI0034101C37